MYFAQIGAMASVILVGVPHPEDRDNIKKGSGQFNTGICESPAATILCFKTALGYSFILSSETAYAAVWIL